MSNFTYYKLQLKLLTPMLGTGTEASIYHEHVIEKAKKEIASANRLAAKVAKAQQKYVGAELTEDKSLKELKSVLRTYCQLVGRPLDIPSNDAQAILIMAQEVEAEFQEQIKARETVKATVFMRNADGTPIIGTHMVLGNLKENLRIVVNSGDKTLIKSKVAVAETMALDVKFVEDFMVASNDILRGTQADADKLPCGKGKNTVDGKGRILLERPIRFDRMGKQETAIQLSEQLPVGTEFSCTMRVRSESAMNLEALKKTLDLGKSNGLGAWRGSGNMGSYCYKIEEIEYQENLPGGWE